MNNKFVGGDSRRQCLFFCFEESAFPLMKKKDIVFRFPLNQNCFKEYEQSGWFLDLIRIDCVEVDLWDIALSWLYCLILASPSLGIVQYSLRKNIKKEIYFLTKIFFYLNQVIQILEFENASYWFIYIYCLFFARNINKFCFYREFRFLFYMSSSKFALYIYKHQY